MRLSRPGVRVWFSRVLLTLLAFLASEALGPASAQVGRADEPWTVATWRGREVVAGEVLVQFAAGASGARQDAASASLGCRRLGAVSPTLARIALPAGADLDSFLQRWQALPDVAFAQPNAIHRPVGVPTDPKWPLQWGLPKVRAELAWDSFTGDPAAVLAVIDSGVDVDHPDLVAHYAWGHDFAAADSDPDDQSGHGTHCCGIAAAETDNGLGVAGVAPGCRFAAYRCGDATFASSALVAAINDARIKGALVLSMSWGSTWNDPAIRIALQAARDAGCVLVAAAGNDASTLPFYPAAHDFVIAVGASNSSDGKAAFSNYGSWVDVAAPGQSIQSTWKGGTYQYASGTSMACPLVAGMADLLYARLGGARSTANAAKVRAALESTTVPVGSWVAHGRVDLLDALAAIAAPLPAHIASVAPASVPAIGGGPITLGGSAFTGVASVTVDGLPAPAFSVLDDVTLQVTAPPAIALGPGVVVVSKPVGASNAGSFTWVETQPPQVVVPAVLGEGQACLWRYGAGAGAGYALIASLDGATFLHAGQPILLHFVVLSAGLLDGAGLGSVSGTLPPGTAGITFRSQLLTKDGSLAASAIVATTITP